VSDAPQGAWTGRRLALAAVPLAVLAWAFADLLLRRDLPGASTLQHAGFRTLVVPLEWLTEGDGERLRLALLLWLLALTSAALGHRRGWARGVLAGSAAVVVAAELVTVALAVLMERGLALGVALAVGLYLWKGRDRSVEERPRPAVLAAGALAAAASLYYVYALFMTQGSGYPLLIRLGEALRLGGASFLPLWAAAVLGLGVIAVLLRRSTLRVLPWTAGPGVVLAAFGSPVGALVAVPASVAVVALLEPSLGGLRGPARWPLVLAVPCVLAGVLFGHTYSARVLRCPSPDDDRVRLLAAPGEVFRVAHGPGDTLLLSQRTDRAFGRLHLGSGQGIVPAVAGPLGHPGDGPEEGGRELFGHPEELVFAHSHDRFYGSVVPADAERWRPLTAPGAIRNLVAVISGDGRTVLDAFGLPGLCWINTLHWSEDDGVLYAGCEERPGLHRVDPDGQRLVDGTSERRLADVQDLAFGQGELADRLFTISLWRSRYLSELDRSDLALRRRARIGGMSYHLAYDPQTSLLFASGWYAGRVRVVDAASMELIGALPAGFGVREVAVHRELRLLLASGTYDGALRAWRLRDDGLPEPLARVPVGGHVKDIRVDQGSERAWFWSQCGLYELDLARLGE